MVLLSFNSLLADTVAVVAILFSLILLYFNYKYRYWAKKNVPYLEPKFPYGNYPYFPLKKVGLGPEAKTWYDELKKRGHKFGGVWALSKPILVVVDPDYVRDILSRDFNHFTDRDSFTNSKDDPISNHLVNITGEGGWKNLRQKLTPTFTSGKMKMMFDGILQCSEPMVRTMEILAGKKKDVPILDLLTSFTSDVIGNVAFGVECNSFDGQEETEFKKMTKELFKVPLKRAFQLFLAMNLPSLAKLLNIRISRKVTREFFGNLVRSTEKYREENNITRPDFLQLLLELKKQTTASGDPFTYDHIVANTTLFFIAGFDTSSTAMNFALYKLSQHPEVQEKLRNEINDVLEKNNGKLTYDNLNDMVYLKQVLDESMRLNPPVFTLSRRCTEDYKLRGTNITIEKGTPVAISANGLHMDPEYYPDPEKFDPDRFSAENKAKRHPYVHLPFGEGPRNCIGLRFGLMQSKIGLVQIVKNFRITMSPSTKLPLTPNPNMFLLKSRETLYLNFEKI